MTFGLLIGLFVIVVAGSIVGSLVPWFGTSNALRDLLSFPSMIVAIIGFGVALWFDSKHRLRQLLVQTHFRDPVARKEAIEELPAFRPRKTLRTERLERLTQLLEDPEEDVRRAAVHELRMILSAAKGLVPHAVIDTMARLFELPDWKRARFGYLGLSAVVDDVLSGDVEYVLETLLRLSAHERSQVRDNAADLLGALAMNSTLPIRSRAVDRLFELRSDPVADVRRTALATLCTLIKKLPEEERVRVGAQFDEEFEWAPEGLRSDDPDARAWAARVHYLLPNAIPKAELEPAAERLFASTRDTGKDLAVKAWDGLFALGERVGGGLATRVAETAIAEVRSAPEDVRKEVAGGLGGLARVLDPEEVPRVLAVILELANDESPDVRGMAAFGASEAALLVDAPLRAGALEKLKAMKKDSSEYVRASAFFAVMSIEDPTPAEA